MKNGGVVLLGCLFLLMLANCTKDKATVSNCQTCSTISFKNDVVPIFKQNCALAGCHLNVSGHINLDSAVAYAQVTAPGKGYVVAGNPGFSILYLQMTPGGSPVMPPAGLLDACTSQKIYCWIQQGALNN